MLKHFPFIATIIIGFAGQQILFAKESAKTDSLKYANLDLHYEAAFFGDEYFSFLYGKTNAYTFNTEEGLYIFIEEIIHDYENRGYPFASIKATDLSRNEDTVKFRFQVSSGPYILLKKIEIKGDTKLKPGFVTRYLGLKKGTEYNQESIDEIDKKLKNLTYISSIRAPIVEFDTGYASLYIFADENKASRFSGFAALAPINEGNQGQLKLTGELNLYLVNLIGRGESFAMQWNSLGESSQSLDLSVSFPYLLNTPFGISAGFSLLKQDTSYLSGLSQINLNYYFNQLNYTGLLYRSQFSGTTGNVSEINGNLAIKDFNKQEFGLEFFISQYDDLVTKMRGYTLKTNILYGTKKYDNGSEGQEAISSVQGISTTLDGQISIPWGRKASLGIDQKFGLIDYPDLIASELFRIGGINSLRGFLDNEFFSNAYAISTLEPGIVLDQTSSIFAFGQYAFLQNALVRERLFQKYALGMGIRLQTRAGLLTAIYALGNDRFEPFQFKGSKVHIGYLSTF